MYLSWIALSRDIQNSRFGYKPGTGGFTSGFMRRLVTELGGGHIDYADPVDADRTVVGNGISCCKFDTNRISLCPSIAVRCSWRYAESVRFRAQVCGVPVVAYRSTRAGRRAHSAEIWRS